MKIKQLEFETIEGGTIGAQTAFGYYEITNEVGAGIMITLNELDILWEADSIEEAKRITQQDFEARINSHIEDESEDNNNEN